MKKTVFSCRKCGQCCTGQGGIVLARHDLQRLCDFFGLAEADFISTYAVVRNSKLQLRVSGNECVFFKSGQGCSVHEYKPDICRAWPFFRGNMIDAISFEMAKEFCSGIDPEAGFADFVAEGRIYLEENKLAAKDPLKEANALVVDLS